MSKDASSARLDARVLLLGQGRVSRHLFHYFSRLLKIPCETLSWRAVSQTQPRLSKNEFSHIFLLGRDQDLLAQNQWVEKSSIIGNRVHCSARVDLEAVSAWHPLASFATELFADEFYSQVVFVGNEKSSSLAESVLKTPNKERRVLQEDRERYHARCVFASNLTAAILARSLESFENEFALSAADVSPLIRSTIENVEKMSWDGITGPLVRGDLVTMAKNHQALSDPLEKKIYEAIYEMSRSHFHPESLATQPVDFQKKPQNKGAENANKGF